MLRFGLLIILLAGLPGLGGMSAAQAMTLVESDVQHENGSYRVSFEFTVDAPTNRVRALMSDFIRFDRLVASITEIRVVEGAPSGRTRLKLVINDCVLFFCRSLTRVEDIVTEPNGDIVTTVLPEHSDFSFAVERWRIVPNGTGTRVYYNAQLTPSIFIPPLIGPIAMKYKIRAQLEETVSTLEALARDTAVK